MPGGFLHFSSRCDIRGLELFSVLISRNVVLSSVYFSYGLLKKFEEFDTLECLSNISPSNLHLFVNQPCSKCVAEVYSSLLLKEIKGSLREQHFQKR